MNKYNTLDFLTVAILNKRNELMGYDMRRNAAQIALELNQNRKVILGFIYNADKRVTSLKEKMNDLPDDMRKQYIDRLDKIKGAINDLAVKAQHADNFKLLEAIQTKIKNINTQLIPKIEADLKARVEANLKARQEADLALHKQIASNVETSLKNIEGTLTNLNEVVNNLSQPDRNRLDRLKTFQSMVNGMRAKMQNPEIDTAALKQIQGHIAQVNLVLAKETQEINATKLKQQEQNQRRVGDQPSPSPVSNIASNLTQSHAQPKFFQPQQIRREQKGFEYYKHALTLVYKLIKQHPQNWQEKNILPKPIEVISNLFDSRLANKDITKYFENKDVDWLKKDWELIQKIAKPLKDEKSPAGHLSNNIISGEITELEATLAKLEPKKPIIRR